MTQYQFHKTIGALAALALIAQPIQAEVWHAMVGAQSIDEGKQALAFLPNEFWVHVGDSITWAFPTGEAHTVSFLTTGQIRPSSAQVGCPGATVTSAACVNSGLLKGGATYTVTFATAGNFKLVCLVHVRMTGAVHVLNLSESLPHDQAFYDRDAERARTELLSDASGLEGRGIATAQLTSDHGVTAGIAAVVATGGGASSASVYRFLQGQIVVHVGDTVEWTTVAPVTRHTVTFGTEPANLALPSPGVKVDPDGALHAIIASPTDSVNSGLVGSPGQESAGTPQLPLDVTRFRVTFIAPGVFNYICAIHDELGMVGTVIVNR